ncbi:COMM domain-containing protein 4 isoform X2 [Mobula hypostoma]|uniref:COMM domain-containing protein 4 isoform X2 n=1 Tax=Mobula hypostoma TaxID=723540 RepID=UPI002FC3B947
MRFRFCGDLDCPDWVLAEISTLAKVSSVKIKLLCVQYEKITKLTADAKFDSSDIKATIAVLNFVLSSAAKYGVNGESLSSELQQLGLPKEHAVALCKSYEDKHTVLQDKLKESSLRLNKLDSVSWRVDYTLSSSEMKEVNEPIVHLKINVKNVDTDAVEPTVVSVSTDKFRVLLTELKQAQALMNALN